MIRNMRLSYLDIKEIPISISP